MMDTTVSGTRKGITEKQFVALGDLIAKSCITKLHHGDCIGADLIAHNIMRLMRVVFNKQTKIIAHPPKNEVVRAFCDADEIREPDDYIPRNHTMVDESEWLIALPSSKEELLRSGTWATVRYAKKLGRHITIIYPDGEIKNVKKNLV
jgi:hypothetical protein